MSDTLSEASGKKVGHVEHALRGVRELLSVDIGIAADETRFEVSALCHELPESEIEDMIAQASLLSGTSSQMPKRKDLEAAGMAKGNSLATLGLDARRKSYKPRYDVREKNCTARRVLVSEDGEELGLRFSLLSQDLKALGRHTSSPPPPLPVFAAFELLADLDTLDTLAELVVDLYTMLSIETDSNSYRFDARLEPFRQIPLRDLNLKLGDRILLRQGNFITHRLVLSDLYLMARFRPRRIPPSLVFLHSDSLKNRTSSCEVCRAYSARTLVSNDPRCPKSNMLFCDQCLHMFYYTAEGNLHPSTEELIDPQKTITPLEFTILF